MKKRLFLLLSAAASILPLHAARFLEIDGVIYSVDVVSKECGVFSANDNCSGDVVIRSSVSYEGANYTVTFIGYRAFSRCSDLNSVTIPNSVTVIGQSAFEYCSNLTSVTIGDSVKAIDSQAFRECASLTSITIPNSVTTIGTDIFFRCTNLASVSLPNSMTHIAFGMFKSCTSLTSVTIPNSVTTIESGAFDSCASLTSVNIPNSVECIGGYAFAACSSLTSVEIGSGIKTIEEGAFGICTNLKTLKVDAQIPPETNRYVFYDTDCYDSTTLYIPKESIELYKETSPWSQFFKIDTTDNYKPNENGIDTIEIDTEEKTEVYNLNGVKIADSLDNLPNGIYIKRSGNTTRKVFINR